MKNFFNTLGSNGPISFITINKQRIKQYTPNIVYLKNGQEFEIELFNPTQSKVLVKIQLNGVSIGNGLVIKPGQRSYLERYVNEARKFIFETYEVDENDPQTAYAIAKNGNVRIEFYKEATQQNQIIWNQPWNQPITYIPNSNDTIWWGGYSGATSNTDINYMSANAFYTSSITSTPINGIETSASGYISDFKMCSSSSLSNKVNETGRIEKGSNSNQTFGTDYSDFEFFTFKTIEWKILPESKKAITPSEIITYCSSCGAKRKKQSHKFCPQCGNKF